MAELNKSETCQHCCIFVWHSRGMCSAERRVLVSPQASIFPSRVVWGQLTSKRQIRSERRRFEWWATMTRRRTRKKTRRSRETQSTSLLLSPLTHSLSLSMLAVATSREIWEEEEWRGESARGKRYGERRGIFSTPGRHLVDTFSTPGRHLTSLIYNAAGRYAKEVIRMANRLSREGRRISDPWKKDAKRAA